MTQHPSSPSQVLPIRKAFVTGAAGFIGSNLVDELLRRQVEVVGWDDFSSGQREFLETAIANPAFTLIEGSTLDREALATAMLGCDFVFHLAANADVRFGLNHPERDLQQNTIATFNVLEAMRSNSIARIAFSSTGSVYGECTVIPTPEDAPFPMQTSLYGASKVAGECLVQAYAEGYQFEGYIFRFVSILGERYTHGHVFDFCQQLLADPTRLKVLGDGMQRKSYLYVQDCVAAILHAVEHGTAAAERHRCSIFNLGTNEYCRVTDSIKWIASEMGVTPKLEFTGGERGWVGDNPFIFLDTSRIRSRGWSAKLSIEEGVRSTVKWLTENRWVFERRS